MKTINIQKQKERLLELEQMLILAKKEKRKALRELNAEKKRSLIIEKKLGIIEKRFENHI